MQIGVIGLGRMGGNISQTARGSSSSDIPRPPSRKTGDPRGESGYVHAGPAGAGHLLSSALYADSARAASTPSGQPVGALYVSEKLERVAPHVQPARAGT